MEILLYIDGGPYMARFCIVHLSDLHIKSVDNELPEYGRLRDNLIKDLNDQLEIHKLKLDVLVITGDIIDKGADLKKYEAASLFLDKLKENLKIEKEQIRIVPGNHDFDRHRIANSAVKSIRIQDNDDDIEIFRHNWDVSIKQKCRMYYDFLKDNLDINESVFSYGGSTYNFISSQGCINFIMLDSAWSSIGDEDYQNLIIGKYQLEEVLLEYKKLPKADLTIAMMHHPVEWFKPEQGKMLKSFLMSSDLFGTEILFHGHIHEAEIGVSGNPDGSLCTLVSGIGYPESGIKEKKLSNCRYVIYEFNTDQKAVKCFSRKSTNGGKFVADTELYSTGRNTGIYEIDYDIKKKL